MLYNNIYFLTPLCGTDRYFYCDILPYADTKMLSSSLPIYIVQGSFMRRSSKLLECIMQEKYNHNFVIKLLNDNKDIPEELKPYSDKIIHCKNMNFKEYHKQFINAYCILPLTSYDEQLYYYTTKLTSSINYALGYKMKIIIDADLQNIYNMSKESVYIFNNYTDIAKAFRKSLEDFYNNKN